MTKNTKNIETDKTDLQPSAAARDGEAAASPNRWEKFTVREKTVIPATYRRRIPVGEFASAVGERIPKILDRHEQELGKRVLDKLTYEQAMPITVSVTLTLLDKDRLRRLKPFGISLAQVVREAAIDYAAENNTLNN